MVLNSHFHLEKYESALNVAQCREYVVGVLQCVHYIGFISVYVNQLELRKLRMLPGCNTEPHVL